MVIRILKFVISLAIAGVGYLALDTVRWSAFKAMSLQIPPHWYEMRLERLAVGGAILLLGILCAITTVIPDRRR